MNILNLIFDALRIGGSVKDAVKAKNQAMLGVALGGVISLLPTLAKLGGYSLEISQEDAAQIGVTIATVAGMFGTYATSDKVGILPAKAPTTPDSPITTNSPIPASPNSDMSSGA